MMKASPPRLDQEGPNQPVDVLRVHGGTENESPARSRFPEDGDDKVGKIPVAQEDVADVDPLTNHLLEPGIVGVIPPFQLEGTRIGNLGAIGFDEAQIYEGSKGCLHVLQNGGQEHRILEVRVGLLPQDILKGRGPLFQEGLHGLLAVGDKTDHGPGLLFPKSPLILVVVHPGHDEERGNGNKGHRYHGRQEDPSVPGLGDERVLVPTRDGSFRDYVPHALLQSPFPASAAPAFRTLSMRSLMSTGFCR